MRIKKYELLETHSIDDGFDKLFRIRALRSFGDVKEGQLGGYVESELNLSHEGDSWVYYWAKVKDNAKVIDNAKVRNSARVIHDAVISGNAVVYDEASVEFNAVVKDNAQVYGNARITGNSEISGNAKVYGNADICDNACVFDNAKIYDHARVEGGSTIIGGSVRVSSFCEIGGSTTVGGDIELTSEFDIFTFQNPYSGNIFTWVEPSDKIYKKNFKDFLSNKVDSSITIDQLREGEKEGSTYPNKAVKVFDLYVKMIKDIKKIKNE